MKDKTKKKPTRNALDILDKRHPPVGQDLELRATFGEAIEIAEMILQLREEAGLTQRELAKRVGTTASVICRLEDADYEGHSMAMLRRIAEAVGKRVEVRFVPAA
jgi:ribosome-binding protein aMBF1 (putative translation factor)